MLMKSNLGMVELNLKQGVCAQVDGKALVDRGSQFITATADASLETQQISMQTLRKRKKHN